MSPRARSIRRRFLAANGPLGSFDLTQNVTVDNEVDLGYTPEAESWEYTLDVILNTRED